VLYRGGIYYLLCDGVGCKAASSLFSICNKILARSLHALDTIFSRFVLSTHKLSKCNVPGIVGSIGMLEG
jgi:hypothetical protein